ncbi:unnamed protein product [marine sediment metagenome]|uniref:BPL/LPL catalytic domain-containing protein n=1 Tax=marine sediment metagenome TaxID=412755 RepID=X1SBG7_9ZZZZ
MEKWRLLKLGEVDAYTSNAITEALGLARSRGIIGNTLALYRPPTFVWLGRRTSLSQVNVSFCKENEIPISRSYMGGGVILYGGQIEYTFVSDETFFPSSDIAFNILIKCVVKAYQSLGLPAIRRGNSNDILVGERKITGTGRSRLGSSVLFTGNFLLDFNYDLAKRVLIIPAEKFQDKTAKNVVEWVTSLKKELNREVSFEEAEIALIQATGDVLGVQFEEAGLTVEELAIMDELEAKYKSEEWIKYGKWSPVKDYWRPE